MDSKAGARTLAFFLAKGMDSALFCQKVLFSALFFEKSTAIFSLKPLQAGGFRVHPRKKC